jgi:hypothetical protein
MSAARRKRPPDKFTIDLYQLCPILSSLFALRCFFLLFLLAQEYGIFGGGKKKQLLLKLLRCIMNVVVLDSTAWLQLSGTILVDSQLHVTTRSKNSKDKTNHTRVQSPDKEVIKESRIRFPPPGQTWCVEFGLKHPNHVYMAYGSSKCLFDFLDYGGGLFEAFPFNS